MTASRQRHDCRRAAGVVVLALVAIGCRAPTPAPSAVPDVPVYPGAKLVAPAVDAPDLDPTEGYVVAGANQAQVQAWYRRAMAGRGWRTTSADDGGEVTTYATERGCWGLVSARQDGADVLLQISQQRPGTPCYNVPTIDPGDE